MDALPVSVIVPAADDPRIAECIRSIDESVELVIVFNKPTTLVREAVRRATGRFHRLLTTEIEERNLGKAYNAGITVSTYPVVILMDSDCIFSPGTIMRLYKGTTMAPMCKGSVRFLHRGWTSRVIAMSREYHTADVKNAYSPPLAFRKDIREMIGGYYFDNEIHWCEDHEFDQRVAHAQVEIRFDSQAIVEHPPLSILQDLRSSFRYGMGYRVGIQKGIILGGWIYGGRRSLRESLAIDFARLGASPAYLLIVSRKKSMLTALYMLAWMVAFASGYYFQMMTKHYPIADSALHL
ncbi:glycosyltransferase [Nocardia sp. CC227C]|uniref:glycosyltransferase n=1 Tax=Nocardia sp. CC227C TaxID=3044562 RepID=UPI00278C6B1D|nr:glycosyltransferase [Nocardia sp. CC227C]